MTPANDNNNAMLVTLTVADLKRLIGEAVAEHSGSVQAREYLSPEQLAQRLGVSAASIKTMVTRDKLPAHTLGPKLQRFLWSEVEDWLAARGKNLGDAPATSRLSSLRHMRQLK